MVSDFLEVFTLVRLRFLLSFFPGLHHSPWQLNCTMCSWPHSRQWSWVPHATKTQNHEHISSDMPINTIKSITNNFNLSSWCLPQICWQLRFLNAFQNVAISLHHHRETYENSEQSHTPHNMQTGLASIRFHSRNNASFAMISEFTVPRHFKLQLVPSGMAPF